MTRQSSVRQAFAHQATTAHSPPRSPTLRQASAGKKRPADTAIHVLEEDEDAPLSLSHSAARSRPEEKIEEDDDDSESELHQSRSSQLPVTPKSRTPARGKRKRKAGNYKYVKSADGDQTYPDPNDTDDNSSIAPYYWPSLVASPALFAHVLKHLKLFHISQTPVCEALGTSAGTVSGILHRKYPFKALGMVKKLREFMTNRDATVSVEAFNRVVGCYKETHSVGASGTASHTEIDFNHAALSTESLSVIVNEFQPPISAAKFLSFLRGTLSLEQRSAVEDSYAAWCDWHDAKSGAVAPKRAYTRKSAAVSKSEDLGEPISASGRPVRSTRQPRHQMVGIDNNGNDNDDSEVYVDNGHDSDSDNDAALLSGRKWSSATKSRAKHERAGSGYPHKRSIVVRARRLPSLSSPSPFSHSSWSIPRSSIHFLTQSLSLSNFVYPHFESLTFLTGDLMEVRLPAFTAQQYDGDVFINAGGPISTIEWTPVGNDRHSPQSLPLSLVIVSDDSERYHGKYRRDRDGIVQVWSLGIGADCLDTNSVTSSQLPRLSLAVRHNRGDVRAAQWLDYNDWQDPLTVTADYVPRLGMLAIAFGDGSAVITAIPQPESLSSLNQPVPIIDLSSLPQVSLSLPPLFQLSLTEPPVPLCLASSRTDYRLAVGRSDGGVFVYDLTECRSYGVVTQYVDLWSRPGDYGVRSLTFSPTNPNHLVLGTQDGFVQLWDLRVPVLPMMHVPIISEPVLGLTWLTLRPDCLLLITRDSVRVTMLLKGSDRFIPLNGFNALPLTPSAAVWDLSVLEDDEDTAVIVAAGTSDGQVVAVAQSTTLLDRDRTSGSIRTRGLSLTRYITDTQGVALLQMIDGFEVADVKAREAKTQREARSKAGLLTLDAPSLAMDNTVAVTHVRFNPNIVFPRMLASGGLSGIVRLRKFAEL